MKALKNVYFEKMALKACFAARKNRNVRSYVLSAHARSCKIIIYFLVSLRLYRCTNEDTQY